MIGYASAPMIVAPDEADYIDSHQAAHPAAWPETGCDRCGATVRWAVLWGWMAPTAAEEDQPREIYVDPILELEGDYRIWLYLPTADGRVAWPLLVPAITGGIGWRRHRCPVGTKAPAEELVAT